jgi:hypothetical protein
MSLCANGMPDNLINEGLKQPDHIKISSKKGAKEITDHVAPDQAWFGAEYFLAFMLPDFKSKISTRLSDTQKANGPMLFILIGQCFQDIGLSQYVIAKQCPTNADRTKANFNKCIRDCLEAVAKFPNVGNRLIRWLHTAKKPALMPMHKFMRRWVQLISYLDSGYLRWTMEIPTAQEKSEQIFFAQPKAHQFKFIVTNKMVPMDQLKLIAFFEQCQDADKASGILEKIDKDKKQPKQKKTAHLPAARSRDQATSSIVATSITTTIKVTNAIAMTNNLTIVIKTINATIVLAATTRTLRTASPTKRRMIASMIPSRKIATRPCTMTSPLCQAWTTHPE